MQVKEAEKNKCEIYHDIDEVEKAGFACLQRCQPEVDDSPKMGLVRDIIAFWSISIIKVELKDITNHVGVSSYYLERLFKKETLETPRSYLEKIKWIKLHTF